MEVHSWPVTWRLRTFEAHDNYQEECQIFWIERQNISIPFKSNSHTSCRAHPFSLPCCTTKGLECVFPIWFTKYGRVWFTLAMPRPCHAPTVPFFPRPRHFRSVVRRPVGYLLAFGFFPLTRGVSWRLLSAAYQSQMQGGQCETKQRLTWKRKRVVAAHYKKKKRSVKMLD
jgi:hypothetical protein